MTDRNFLACLCVSVVLALAACSKNEPQPKVAHAPEVAWVRPVAADMAPIFAQAKAQNKPMFIYWGAVWCPPCNQVKATVFKRADFIARSQAFIPVYVDGDEPGAQKLGAHFKVRGYPTMILLAPNGEELTRLPGEIEAQTYLDTLDLALQSPLSVKAALQRVEQGQAAQIGAKAWRQLAYYAWDQDQAQLVSADKLVPTLRQLAKACPPDETEAANRLFLKSVVVSALESAKLPDQAAAAQRLQALLKDPGQARQSADVLINYGSEMVKVLSAAKDPGRAALVQALNSVLDQLSRDQGLSTADRLGALDTQVGLAKLQGQDPDSGLKDRVHQAVLALDREVSDAYERQALIPSAADLLQKAGFAEEAQAMLTAELPKAIAPYYHMSVLSALAKSSGQSEQSVQWSEKAWQASQGPATRLQWGAAYVNRLLELSPDSTERIEAAAGAVLKEVQASPETFFHRNRRVLERMSQRMNEWAQRQNQAEVMARLHAQWGETCAKLPSADEAASVCRDAFKAPAKTGKHKA